MRRAGLLGTVLLVTSLAGPARAEDPPARAEPRSASSVSRDDGGSSGGGRVVGWITAVVGAAAVTAGASILIIDAQASNEEDPDASGGFDFGTGGDRGRDGQTAVGEQPDPAPEGPSTLPGDLGAGLLFGGAALVGVSVALFATSSDGSSRTGRSTRLPGEVQVRAQLSPRGAALMVRF